MLVWDQEVMFPGNLKRMAEIFLKVVWVNIFLIFTIEIYYLKKINNTAYHQGKGSVKLSPASGSSTHKPVIHVSLSLREEVKLNQTKDAWRPTRFKKESLTEEEFKTQVIIIH